MIEFTEEYVEDENGTIVLHRVGIDTETGQAVVNTYKNQDDAANETANEETLLTQYHEVIARIHSRTDLDEDLKLFVALQHRLQCRDFSDAEIEEI